MTFSTGAPQRVQTVGSTYAGGSRGPGWGDAAVLLLLLAGLALILAGGHRLHAPYAATVTISRSPWALPGYAVLSVLRMTAAYLLSMAFALVYGYIAATNRWAERLMVPVLDVLQSIPVASFLPAVVVGLVTLFPNQILGPELAAVLLVFTAQAWNLAFSFYHSLRTLPTDLVEASSLFGLSWRLRFTKLYLPAAAVGLVWNSMMSWAAGWFFLMLSEQFSLGPQSYRLPGLGSYIQEAANAGDVGAMALGLLALVIVIVLLDQLLWRPLTAWSDRFKLELSTAGERPGSWLLDLLQRSALIEALRGLRERLARDSRRPLAPTLSVPAPARRLVWGLGVLAAAALALLGGLQLVHMLAQVRTGQIFPVILDFALTLLRVFTAVSIGALWTIPVGVYIGTRPRVARVFQPIVQVVASVPATALFPVLLLVLLKVAGGLNVASVGLMLLGSQWYVLFNVIAGAMALPNDLREVSALFGLSRWDRWRTLILPGIFPYLITGLITASGGAWNASIVSEYVNFGGTTHVARGLGATIALAAQNGDVTRLFLATATMAVGVTLINRLFWRRLYRVAEERYRLG